MTRFWISLLDAGLLHQFNSKFLHVGEVPLAGSQLGNATHLEKLGVHLTTLTQAQADYIGVKVEGPYKVDFYRY